jgi:hypothetical protein
MSQWDRYVMTVKYLVDQVSASESIITFGSSAVIVNLSAACTATLAVWAVLLHAALDGCRAP